MGAVCPCNVLFGSRTPHQTSQQPKNVSGYSIDGHLIGVPACSGLDTILLTSCFLEALRSQGNTHIRRYYSVPPSIHVCAAGYETERQAEGFWSQQWSAASRQQSSTGCSTACKLISSPWQA